ncbi:MAG: P-II family nitrogen regulator [Nitrosopumilus sp.]|uniref:P-II family nitrogen regulator n=1 Tax=Nitrosopumilus sp. TaxID=2024843 RepID=UPI002930615B|nr:P-II family nitrogen regulator [Nitrosopumilus sp.]
MKRIDAVIPEKNLDAVNQALHSIGVTGVTVFDASGRGKNPPEANQMGYWLYYPRFGNNKVIMVLTSDEDADKAVQCISDSAEAGKVMVTNVENLVDIRKKTKGAEAL